MLCRYPLSVLLLHFQNFIIPHIGEVSQHGTKQRTPQSSGSKMSTDEFAKLEKMIQDRDQIILRLNNELSRVTADFSKLKDDLEPVWVLVKEYKVAQPYLC